MSAGAAPPPGDSKSALMAAARTAIQDQADKAVSAKVTRGGRTHPARTTIFFLLALAGAVLLVVRPAWLAEPATLPPEPPAVAAASVRLTLLRERQRVFDFEKAHGHLPATLAEAGIDQAGLEYARRDSTRFELSAWTGDSLIVLRSADSISTFLGGSLKALTARRNP